MRARDAICGSDCNHGAVVSGGTVAQVGIGGAASAASAGCEQERSGDGDPDDAQRVGSAVSPWQKQNGKKQGQTRAGSSRSRVSSSWLMAAAWR